MPGWAEDRRALAWLLPICLVAFAARAVVAVNMQDAVLFADMQDYHDRALHLLNTGTLWPDAFRVPLYPVFIAGVYAVSGASPLAVYIAQALLGTLTVFLTFILARHVVAQRAALAAAFIVAIYPALVLYSAYLMSETLFAVLAMLALVLWAAARPWAAFGAGVAIGAAILTRSIGMAVAAGIVAGEALTLTMRRGDGGAEVLARVALMTAGVALVLAPWVQRNYALYGQFIPTDTSSGFNALLGNYEGATGRHPGIAAVDEVTRTYWQPARNDAERSSIGMRTARAFVRDHPARAAVLAVRKVGYLFGVEGREHAWGYSHHVQGKRAPGTVWAWGLALIASFPVLMTVASIGMFRPALFLNPQAVIIVMTLAFVTLLHIATFGDSRFHLPWIPLLAILAARAFGPLTVGPWTTGRQLIVAVWLVAFGLTWVEQSRELLGVLPQLADSPEPLRLPY